MSKKDGDYSDYISYTSNVLLVLALFSGFTFASITILITQVPDPSQTLIQVTLFFLTVFLNIFLFASFYSIGCILHSVEDIPPATRGLGYRKAVNPLIVASFHLWGVAIMLMFLSWNLIYLTVASAILYVLFNVSGFVIVTKPNLEHLRKVRSRRKHSM